jgi:peptide methionine sulfoxide reductase msrA/msrB
MMRRLRPFGLALALVVMGACSSSASESPTSEAPKSAAAHEATARRASPIADDGEAYFAGGCFWGVEHYMEQLPGVISVESGYMGGHVEDPSYAQVASQTSGHLETVRVQFDPARISYRDIAKRFFEIHDPTQANGQGPDIGPEYLSAVFYTTDAQKQTAAELIDVLERRGYDVVTELRSAEAFYVAEDFHQDYYARTGKTPYCHVRVPRFGD